MLISSLRPDRSVALYCQIHKKRSLKSRNAALGPEIIYIYNTFNHVSLFRGKIFPFLKPRTIILEYWYYFSRFCAKTFAVFLKTGMDILEYPHFLEKIMTGVSSFQAFKGHF
jgi:hypothetical protein